MKLAVIVLGVFALARSGFGAIPTSLPIQGKFAGKSQCMEMKASQIDPAFDEHLVILIRGLSIENEYEGNDRIRRKNTMVAKPDAKAGLTSETPAFIRSLTGLKVLSVRGKALLENVAATLEKKPSGIQSYILKPSQDVVQGKIFCDEQEKWCHFEAVKRVTIANPDPKGKPLTFEVHGGDTTASFGSEVIRVGYAYDKVSCAPGVCVYVCEAHLTADPQ
jgi:hypothetical protein